MEAQRWERLQVLFEAAQAMPAETADEYLRASCTDDPGLAGEVRALLAALGRTSALGQAVERAALDAGAAAAADAIGRTFGAWRVIGALGQGGMGTVWRAERIDGAYQQDGALKLLNPWLLDAGYVQRFVQERQILANLKHPGIAQLLDGGIGEGGVPFLVMELVEGRQILEYANQAELDLPLRLAVFRKVCGAVQHAHQNFVVHRDIKPGNILVTPEGEPKLLDFGIAKVLGAGQRDETRAATRLLTPDYASPEQLRGEGVTTASDVYSLGIVLYELLSGKRPPTREGKSTDPAVPRPSTQVARALAAGSAHMHAGRARAWLKRLRGDLDTVVLKALAFEPERRYATAREFADDLGRVLESRPVLARPDAWSYRTRLFVQRNLVPVAFAAALVLFLIGASIALLQLSLRLADERDRAEREARTATEVSAFALGLFRGANPQNARGALPTLRDLLDRGAERIETELAGHPLVQAKMLREIGDAYRQISQPEKGRVLLERAVALYEAHGQANTRDFSVALDSLGELQRASGRLREAEATHRRNLALRESFEPRNLVDVAQSMNNVGLTILDAGRVVEAKTLLARTLEIRRATVEPDSHNMIASLINYGIAQRDLGEVAESEATFRDALARRRRGFGDRHMSTAVALAHVARSVAAQGRHDEAASLEREALDIRRDVFGERSSEVAQSLANLASFHAAMDRTAEAEAGLRQALAIESALAGPEATRTLGAHLHLARLLRIDGRLDEAESLLVPAYEARRERLDPGSPALADATLQLAQLRIDQGRLEDARAMLAATRTILDLGALPADHPDRSYARAIAARLAARKGDVEAARREAVAACDALRFKPSKRAADPMDCRAILEEVGAATSTRR